MANKRTFNKRMWLRIAACLLCLIVIAVTLDSLPDSPAVNPQIDAKALVSLPYHQLSAAVNYKVVDCVSCAPHFQTGLISFGQIFESRGPAFKLERVQRAIDTSPPELS
jgi:hypothetical protein